ncbi:MAG TPA: hypothetical protein VMF13_23535, partial [Luteitalea sp.]|nr:hypothetical protein [Luteitalea sp.]
MIHDSTRDQTAQQTVSAAKEVTSGSLVAAMLKNVEAQSRLEVETEIAFLQERMRARLYAFEVWQGAATPVNPLECRKSVECQLRELQARHKAALAAAPTQAEVDARLAAIKARVTELQAELKALREASKTSDPFVIRAFAALEDPGQDLIDYAQRIVGLASDSPTRTGATKALNAI